MMKLTSLAVTLSVLACATAFAQGPRLRGPELAPVVGKSIVLNVDGRRPTLEPIPAPGVEPYASVEEPYTIVEGSADGEAIPMPMPAGDCELFPCVKYRGERRIAPCAVPMIVSVRAPKNCDDPCDCYPRGCVNVKICVPPCSCCPEIKIKRQGDRVKYCFGDYAVVITSKRNSIIVDYRN